MNYWLAVGTIKNWHTAFKYRNIWGLKETQRHLWESLKENDKMLFYATSPVSGIIGHGIIRTNFKQRQPIWPDEIKQRKVIWPLRFEFDVKFCLPPDKWVTAKVTSKELWPRAGFQLISKDISENLISTMRETEYPSNKDYEPLFVSEPIAEFTSVAERTGKILTSHGEVQDALVQIGELQNYIAEKEYPFDIGKLDVVWRRVLNSVPTYVFEVQVGGDIYHALAKLKHAFDLWNSHIFLVAAQEDHGKAEGLLAGTFHEISKRIKFIDLEKVVELYERKKSYFYFEKQLGISI